MKSLALFSKCTLIWMQVRDWRPAYVPRCAGQRISERTFYAVFPWPNLAKIHWPFPCWFSLNNSPFAPILGPVLPRVPRKIPPFRQILHLHLRNWSFSRVRSSVYAARREMAGRENHPFQWDASSFSSSFSVVVPLDYLFASPASKGIGSKIQIDLLGWR